MAAPIQVPVDFDYSSGKRTTDRVVRDLERTFERLGRSGRKNLRPLGEGLSAATANASEFDKSLAAANARVIAFGASAGLVVKVQQAFAALVKSTIDVEKSLKDINVILGASEKQLSKFGTGLFKVAKETGQTFETVAAAATELSRQGLSAEKTLQRTKDAMILARLAGMDAVSAVDALTATLNTFTDAGLNSTKVVNKLAKVDAAFAVSSQDLAQALQRVGASAKGAGVSFDELLAIVTAAQQKTARGGAVIGNSFKTIFTRIQRPEVLNQLERLGIAVRDLQGNTLPAIRILDGLSRTFDTLSDSQKSIISEQVAGVFQINILKAALSDLNSEYGIYQGALRAASSATNEAVQRNQELNTTTAALLNQTIQSFKELGSTVGAVSLAPAMKDLLGGINTVLGSLTEAAGTQIGQGILSGIGKFIGGPGLAIAGVIGGKLLFNFVKFSKEALSTLMGQNNAAAQQKSLQQNIVALLSQQPNLLAQIQSGQMGANQVAQAYLNTLREQQRLQASIGSVAAGAARAAYAGGARTRGGTVRVPGFALATTPARAGGDGMIPNFAAKTSKEIFGAAVQAERTTNLTNIAAGKQIGAATFSPAQQRAAASVLARRKAGQKRESKTASKDYIATGLNEKIGVLTGVGVDTTKNLRANLSSLTTKSPKVKELMQQGFTHVTVPNVKYRTAFQENEQKQFSDLINNQTMRSAIGSIASDLSYKLFKDEAKDLQPKIQQNLNKLTLDAGAEGSIFEAASRLFLGGEFPTNQQAAFDFEENSRPSSLFRKFFNFGEGLVRADAKRTGGVKIASNIVNKTFNDSRTADLGYPNFSALGAAIAREKAAGIPSGAIRVGRSSQLVGPSNPQGLAVYNTIDEPRGLSQGINRYKSAGLNPKAAGMPNFAVSGGSTAGILGMGGDPYVNVTHLAKAAKAQEANTKAVKDSTGKLLGFTFASQMALSVLEGFGFQPKSTGGRAAMGGIQGAITGAGVGAAFGPHAALAFGIGGAVVGAVSALDNSEQRLRDINNKFSEINVGLTDLSSGLASGDTDQLIKAFSLLPPEVQKAVGGIEKLSQESIAAAQAFANTSNILSSAAISVEKSWYEKTLDKAGQIGKAVAMTMSPNAGFEDVKLKNPLSNESKRKELGVSTARGLAGFSIGGKSVAELFAQTAGAGAPSAEKIKEFYGQSVMGITASRQMLDLLNQDNKDFNDAFIKELKEIGNSRLKLVKQVQETYGAKTGLMADFLGEFRFLQEDRSKFMTDSVKEVANTMKSSFKDGFKSFIDGSKNASEAFRSFALTILDKLTDISLSYATNSLFSSFGAGVSALAGGGYGKFYARGGMVNGGSGVRDDVPAMLMGGEYVVKKSAVDALGVGFLNRINSYAEGGVVASNQFQKGTLGTRGSFNVGAGLSALAITSDLNPQNALRDQMAQEDEQRVQRYLEYQERKRQAMAAYKQQKQQRRIGAITSAAMTIGSSTLGNYLGGTTKAAKIGYAEKMAKQSAEMRYLQNKYEVFKSTNTFNTPKLDLNSNADLKNVNPSATTFELFSSDRFGRAQGGSMSTNITPVKPLGTSSAPMPMSFSGGGSGGATAMLAASIQQLSQSIQSGGGAAGGETVVNLTFNIDKSGEAKAEGGDNKKNPGEPSSTEDQKKEKEFGEMIKSVVLETITKQKRPGGLLFKAS